MSRRWLSSAIERNSSKSTRFLPFCRLSADFSSRLAALLAFCGGHRQRSNPLGCIRASTNGRGFFYVLRALAKRLPVVAGHIARFEHLLCHHCSTFKLQPLEVIWQHHFVVLLAHLDRFAREQMSLP